MQVQGVIPVDGLTWKEVILGILLPLVLGSYAYIWLTGKSLWAGITATRLELKEEIEKAQTAINRVVSNDLRHLEDRVTRLEDRE